MAFCASAFKADWGVRPVTLLRAGGNEATDTGLSAPTRYCRHRSSDWRCVGFVLASGSTALVLNSPTPSINEAVPTNAARRYPSAISIHCSNKALSPAESDIPNISPMSPGPGRHKESTAKLTAIGESTSPQAFRPPRIGPNCGDLRVCARDSFGHGILGL